MNPPTPGLRPLFNKSNSAQRVELIVPAGDEIHVSDAVASQLPGSFAPKAEPKAEPKSKPTVKPKAEPKAADVAGD